MFFLVLLLPGRISTGYSALAPHCALRVAYIRNTYQSIYSLREPRWFRVYYGCPTGVCVCRGREGSGMEDKDNRPLTSPAANIPYLPPR